MDRINNRLNRSELYLEIIPVYAAVRQTKPEVSIPSIMLKRYQVSDCRLMSVEQIADFLKVLKNYLSN